ncbi:MAG: Histone family protein DNA-binding protein [Thermoanaerobacterales bacterium 50_218]|nr:MAG: Histone family protein DNA-binding protein [Thermoanaerobacterales bacterium 50_218]
MSANTNRTKTKDVVKKVAERMSCYQKDAKELLEHFTDLIAEEVSQGRQVRFAPLGTFYARPAKKPRRDGTRRLLLRFKPSKAVLRKLEEVAGEGVRDGFH